MIELWYLRVFIRLALRMKKKNGDVDYMLLQGEYDHRSKRGPMAKELWKEALSEQYLNVDNAYVQVLLKGKQLAEFWILGYLVALTERYNKLIAFLFGASLVVIVKWIGTHWP